MSITIYGDNNAQYLQERSFKEKQLSLIAKITEFL